MYGTETSSEAEIEDAARSANAHEFISNLKDGYDTWCGERGFQLSGGQKQRVAIARAILKNPSILLLDEATSALDSSSENVVQEALDRVMIGRTTVVVAHRLTSIMNCDLIAVLDRGVIVEEGTHAALMAEGPSGTLDWLGCSKDVPDPVSVTIQHHFPNIQQTNEVSCDKKCVSFPHIAL